MKKINLKIDNMFRINAIFVTILLFIVPLLAFAQNPDIFIERNFVSSDSTWGYSIFQNNLISSKISGIDQNNHSVSFYSHGNLHGPNLKFENGTLISSSVFNEGKCFGTELNFNDSGALKFVLNRDSIGELHGLLYEFNEFGELSFIFNYEHGKMIGLLFNGGNKGFAPPYGYISERDSVAWRLKLDRDLLIEKK